MKEHINQKGFTLIEIIIVIIILGVLAAIAIPTYFSWIERSRATEALLGLKIIKEQIDVCTAAHGYSGTYVKCFDSIINSQATGGDFVYANGILSSPDTFFDGGMYSIIALRQENGAALPNDPCWDGCPVPMMPCGITAIGAVAPQSGIEPCQSNPFGIKKIIGWGTFEGTY